MGGASARPPEAAVTDAAPCFAARGGERGDGAVHGAAAGVYGAVPRGAGAAQTGRASWGGGAASSLSWKQRTRDLSRFFPELQS